MELVPIIYTALEIVALLAILTLTFSYVSYKVKQKNGTAPPNRSHKHIAIPRITINKHVDEANKAAAPNNKPAAPKVSPPKPEIAKSEKPKPEVEEGPKLEPKIIQSIKPKAPQQSDKPARNEDSSRQKRQEEKPHRDKSPGKTHHKEKPRPNISRIEVLNTSKNSYEPAPSPKQDFQPVPLSKEKLNSLGDDYLDNYAEDEDKDKAAFTLKTKENKNNQEKK